MNRISLDTAVTFLAAADGEAAGEPIRFSMEAYTGAAIRQGWSREPVVIDLDGMQLKQQIPIVLGHDYSLGSILGQTTSIRAENGRLLVEGEILASNETAAQVIALAQRGYQWQASVGADVRRHQKIDAEREISVNGQQFAGPVRIVKASALREVSFVTLGADADTAVSIAAEESAEMEETTMAQDATETPAEVTAEAPAIVAVEAPAPVVEAAAPVAADEIKTLTEKVAAMEKLIATREQRAPAIHVAEPVNDAKSIEAALCLQAGLPSAETHFDARTLEAGEKAKRTASLGQLLVEAARSNGYDGGYRLTNGNLPGVLRAAFATHDISDILSNVANKFLLSGFTAVERNWDAIAQVRSVSDFKAINLFRLNGSFKFSKVGNGGELKSADASDEKRSVNADEYGVSSTVTRVDLINDDMGALTAVNSRIGRGAALSLNDVIWSEFQSGNASYYAKATAGSGNALSLDSLKAATTAFRKLKDPDGEPLGISPRVLLVPPELEITAAELMGSSLIVSGDTKPNANVLAGRYRVVTSSYLTSATTWWLCADAADLNALDVVFLNGQQSPTIEQVDVNMNTLGIGIRGYMDFGCAKGEGNAAYRMATA